MKKRAPLAGPLALCAALCLLFTTAGAAAPKSSAPEAEPAHDGYLIKLREGAEPPPLLLASDGEPVLRSYEFLDGVFRADSLEEAQALLDPGWIEYVEPNYQMELFSAPNEPAYGQGLLWSLDALGMNEMWDSLPLGTGVRVGVIDSGVYAENPDFEGAHFVTGRSYIDGTTDTTDTFGHGTFVTGVIAAQRGNGIGAAGIAPDVEIVPLQCFSDQSDGDYGTIANAIRACATPESEGGYGCQIINMSFGGTANTQTLHNAVQYAVDQGLILVAAVGNDKDTRLRYPAAYDGVIGVGSVDINRTRAVKSNYNVSVDVAAPGQNVYGLKNSTDPSVKPGSGTSYAAPCVSAAAALAKSMDPDLDAAGFLSALRLSSEDLGPAGRDDEYGYGLVSVPGLLAVVRGRALCVTSENADGGLSLRRCDLPPGEEVVVITATYDAAGRLTAAGQIRGAADSAGVLFVDSLPLDIPADTARARVFFLDPQDMTPLGPPFTLPDPR